MGMKDWRLATTSLFWEKRWITSETLEGFHNPNTNDNPGMTTPPPLARFMFFNHSFYVHHQLDRLIKLVAWVLVLFNVVTVFSLSFVCNFCLICCNDYCVDKKKHPTDIVNISDVLLRVQHRTSEDLLLYIDMEESNNRLSKLSAFWCWCICKDVITQFSEVD